jgi:hypothetical protein
MHARRILFNHESPRRFEFVTRKITGCGQNFAGRKRRNFKLMPTEIGATCELRRGDVVNAATGSTG